MEAVVLSSLDSAVSKSLVRVVLCTYNNHLNHTLIKLMMGVMVSIVQTMGPPITNRPDCVAIRNNIDSRVNAHWGC